MAWRRERTASVGSCGQGVGSRSDDRAQGVGGQRGAEVKVAGREGVRRAGRRRAGGPSRLPPSLADPPPVWGPRCRFLGLCHPPDDSGDASLPHRLPSVLSFLPCPLPTTCMWCRQHLRLNISQAELIFFTPNPSFSHPPYHWLPNPPIFMSFTSSPSLLVLPPPSSLLQILVNYFVRNNFKLSPFFQFLELKSYP